MSNYTAIVSIRYHSGSTPMAVQITASSVYQANLLLEHLYGQGNVLSVPTVVN